MAENQNDLDALLAEVNALADEAVADIVGQEPAAPAEETAKRREVGKAPQPPSGKSSTQPTPASETHPTPATPPALGRILKLQVPVIVRLAENRMPLSEILSLSTGAIIEFNKPFDSELDLMVNNRTIGQGRAVKVGENFGLRITRIGSIQDRIQALGRQ